jgi:hypothetical protein
MGLLPNLSLDAAQTTNETTSFSGPVQSGIDFAPFPMTPAQASPDTVISGPGFSISNDLLFGIGAAILLLYLLRRKS